MSILTDRLHTRFVLASVNEGKNQTPAIEVGLSTEKEPDIGTVAFLHLDTALDLISEILWDFRDFETAMPSEFKTYLEMSMTQATKCLCPSCRKRIVMLTALASTTDELLQTISRRGAKSDKPSATRPTICEHGIHLADGRECPLCPKQLGPAGDHAEGVSSGGGS